MVDGADADVPVTKAILDEVVDRIVKMIGDNGKKMDDDVTSLRQEVGLLSTSIKNVQTQVLASKGRFDADRSSSSGDTPAALSHKLQFPKFDGSDDPITWLHKAEQFFRAYGTPDHLKVPTASFYLEAAASQWYYRLEKNQGAPTWPQFVDAINRRFGPPLRSNPLGELTHLRRTSTVDEYQEKFLLLLARCEDVTEAQQIAIFTAGLQQPLSIDVELQKSETLEDAMALARAYERRQVLSADATTGNNRTPTRSAQRPPASTLRTSQQPGATGSTSATPAAPAKPAPLADSRFKRLSPEEMAQRRLEGLCFNCPEKFSKEHAKQCTGKGIYFLELDTEALASEDGGSDDDLQISVAAITGIQSSATLQLPTVVCDKTAAALVDSGSTHSSMRPRHAVWVWCHRPGLVSLSV